MTTRRVFDVHVHFMPPAILRAVWAYFDAAGPKLGRPWPVTYRGTDEERVETLRDLGVEHFSALSYAHKPGVAEFMNDWTWDFAERVPEALRCATFYPEPDAGDYVQRRIDQGVQLFKAHLQVGDFPADDPYLEPVWAALEAAQVPTVLHAGSSPAGNEHTGPGSVETVLRRHPRLPLVIAHLGQPEVDAFCDLALRYDEVRLDTTMAFVDFWDGPAVTSLPPVLRELQDKILFGSDFPNIPYPWEHQVEVLERLDPGEEWLQAVLWDNAARLFGVAS